MTSQLPPATIIQTAPQLAQLVDILAKQTLIAVDTESNSLYAYHGRVCLIQISTRTDDYIIDPFAIDDIAPLGTILNNPHIEKVFHAAEYDLICLRRDFNFEVQNLFDTMYAARITGKPEIGLADLLKEQFNIVADKKHQLDNWGKRPLTTESLRYAQMDTHYLPILRDIYHRKLSEMNALEEAYEVFADTLRIEAKEKDNEPEGFWRIVRPNELSKRQMAILAELYDLRDSIAREEDVPPFKVIDNRTLINLAQIAPANWQELQGVRGIGHRYLRQYGDDILLALDEGRKRTPPKAPVQPRVDTLLSERYIVLHAWRKERAIQRGVDSNIILSKQTLWELARRLPKTEAELRDIVGIGEWRHKTYGEELLKLIATLR